MNAQEQITFLAELIYLANELQELIRDYCNAMVAEKEEESWMEPDQKSRDVPF